MAEKSSAPYDMVAKEEDSSPDTRRAPVREGER